MTEYKQNRFTKYFPLLLDALRSRSPQPMRPAEATGWVRDHIPVPAEDLTRTIQNGRQTIFENDIHWTRFYLAKAGLISTQRRGLWSLTPAGETTHLDADSTWELYVRIRDANRPGAVEEDQSPAPEIDPEESTPSFWFAGATWDGDDQTERFLADGIWVSGYDEALQSVVLRMKPGDRIAIKSSFVRKHDLPFDVNGATVSCMRLKATGTITGNKSDGQTVTVDWDSRIEPRDWYFYTYRTTLVEADAESAMGQKLIAFAFQGADQEYDWWLSQPYWAAKYSKPQAGTSVSLVQRAEEEVDSALALQATYTLDDVIAEGAFQPRAVLEQIIERWRAKKNLVIQGPPGTGKTFLAKRLGYALIGSRGREATRSRLRVVQFHPSLAYEDFVRGWRPKSDGKLDLTDGIFMQAIEAASSEPDREFVLVIEEINRGNPAQIFGELLTLLESGKRRREDAIELAYRRRDDEMVFVPENLFVIGTMNVADRSLALVDLALRRRFAFISLEPSLGPEWRKWCESRGLDPALVDTIADRIASLNTEISAAPSLGSQFRIGHSYVTPEQDERVVNGRAWFHAKVETEIGPILDEYWYDKPEDALKARRNLLAGI